MYVSRDVKSWISDILLFLLSVDINTATSKSTSDHVLWKVPCYPCGSRTSDKINPGVFDNIIARHFRSFFKSALFAVPEGYEQINHLLIRGIEQVAELTRLNRKCRHWHPVVAIFELLRSLGKGAYKCLPGNNVRTKFNSRDSAQEPHCN